MLEWIWKMHAIEWINECMKEGLKKIKENRGSASSGFLHRLGVN